MYALNELYDPKVSLSLDEISHVSGGVIEKQGLYPRKFGDVDYLVYVDGALIGTIYGPRTSPSPDVGSGGSIGPVLHG